MSVKPGPRLGSQRRPAWSRPMSQGEPGTTPGRRRREVVGVIALGIAMIALAITMSAPGIAATSAWAASDARRLAPRHLDVDRVDRDADQQRAHVPLRVVPDAPLYGGRVARIGAGRAVDVLAVADQGGFALEDDVDLLLVVGGVVVLRDLPARRDVDDVEP